MSHQLRVFKTCVIAAAILTLSTPIIDLVSPTLAFALNYVPPEPRRLEGWNAAARAAGVITVLGLVLGIASVIGLLLLRRWARMLATLVPALLLVAYLPVGEISHSGVAFALALMSTGLWGAVLAMAYFAEPSVHFE
jgi:hypothetical protein